VRVDQRRILSALLILLVFVLISSVTMAKEVTVVLGISPREIGGVMEEHIARFEVENPGIKVEWLKMPGVPGEQHSQYVTQLVAKSPTPDVIAMDLIWPGEFASNQWLTPLSAYFPPYDQVEFIDNITSAAVLDDEVYAAPLYINGLHLYYRTDLLEKYGFQPPATWEELVLQAKHITENEKDPMLRGYVSMWAKIEGLFMNYLQFLWGNGGSFFDEAGNVIVNNSVGTDALQFMQDMLYKHEIVPDSVLGYRPDDARVLFQQGRAVFMVVQDFVWPMLTGPDSEVADVVDFTRVPYFEGHEMTDTVCLGGWLLGINRFSQHRAEAWKLIEFMTDHEAQLRMAVVTGNLPTRRAVYDDERLHKEFPAARQQYDDFSVGNVRPSAELGAKYPEVSEIMQTEIHAALLRQKTAKQALDDAVARIQAVLER
jgi:multiple sugar transport system substrate-binding protein